MNLFSQSRWLITGGTSGLGKALAEILAKNNARVAVVARGDAGLKEMAKLPGVLSLRADVFKKESAYAISAQVLSHLGHIDYLVNNASALGASPLKLLVDTDCEDIEAALNANVLAPFRLSKAILPSMLLRKSGTVLNISSDAAVQAYPTWGAYGLSKAALDHMTRIWASELSEHGVRLLSVDPGDMNTTFHEEAVPSADKTQLKDPSTAARQILDWLLSEPSSGERRSL